MGEVVGRTVVGATTVVDGATVVTGTPLPGGAVVGATVVVGVVAGVARRTVQYGMLFGAATPRATSRIDGFMRAAQAHGLENIAWANDAPLGKPEATTSLAEPM